MAIITEEPDPPTPPPKRRTSPPPKPRTPPPPSTRTSPTTKNTANPFQFCLPPNLRRHYSNGRTIKVQTAPNHPQVEVFSIQEGPIKSPDHVLIVHGLGCSTFAFQKIVKSLGQKGVHAVAIDLPGSGFSDKSVVVEEESGDGGGVVSLWDVYNEIREKGLFWGFDQLVEKGYVNYEENEVPKRKRVKAIELDPEEMGRVLGQVIEAMGLAPVDLVLHDSALSLSANWVSENPGILRSVTILDSEPSATALPLWALGVPSDAEAHRILLAGRDGRRAVVGMGKRLNYSLDLAEWSASDGVKALPMQVIWSTGLSKEWSENGQRVAASLPRAKFVTHSGGRWPQEHSADEIAESIYHFVSPLPKSIKQSEEEQVYSRLGERIAVGVLSS
nr:protein AUXIN RESPONSE 4 [Ipomoea batatas]